MEKQEQEWVEAQKIVITMDLIAATKKHLQFLEAVDNIGHLYDGPILKKAIFRYKYCWLPLLNKHTESDKQEFQLVVPLDCEWIWHCHRLNPVRYIGDCIELFGRILDPECVVDSSIEKVCKKQTEEIWQKQYPGEPFELNFGDHIISDPQSKLMTPSTKYDLILAVKRQSSFYIKVSGTMFRDDLYLGEAFRRYKGFLHLVKKNMEMKSMEACVPTYDIDLMWHSHQLHPLSYCKDVFALVGEVLHHDVNDTNQGKGGKLDTGIKTTTKQWGEMFGSLYLGVGSRQVTNEIEGDNLYAMTARCMAARCMAASCKCISEDTEAETSFEMTARCMSAKCKCIIEDTNEEMSSKMTAKCKCIGMEGENSYGMTARCMASSILHV